MEGSGSQWALSAWDVGITISALQMRKQRGHWSQATQQDCSRQGLKPGQLRLKLASVLEGKGSQVLLVGRWALDERER